MENSKNKSKKKTKKETTEQEPPKDEKTQTPEGIPDVDFKKFLGCG
ncbi:MAG: hypothetical protein ABJF11_05090 [Reichenbachiella sp.]